MNLCLLECSLVPAPLHAQAHGPSKKSCSFFTQQLLREDEGVRLRWHLTEDVLSSQPFLAKLDPSASKGTWGKMSFLSHWWDMGDIQESKPWGVQKIKRSSCGYTSDIISKLPLWIIMELGIVWKMLTSPKSKRARFGTSLFKKTHRDGSLRVCPLCCSKRAPLIFQTPSDEQPQMSRAKESLSEAVKARGKVNRVLL